MAFVEILEKEIQALIMGIKNKAVVVRSTYHPVVKQYMDILDSAFTGAGFNVRNVSPKDCVEKGSVVITDSPLVAIKYMLRGFKKHCVWYQGIAPEESFMNNHSMFRFRILSFIEKKVMQSASLLFFVSDEMKRFYEKKYRLDLSRKSFIMPCFNELQIEDRAFFDEKYTENSFVYLGGLQAWQCFEQTVRVYSVVEKRSGYKTRLLVFTENREQAISLIKRYDVKNYEVDFVRPEELSERIRGIKYGFVLREDNPINNVATPTKLSNYLSNGIIPIYSSAIKSFAEYDSELNFGIVCDLNDIETGVENILAHMQKNVTACEIKDKCQTAFSTYYNHRAYIERISEKIIMLGLNQ